MRLDTHVVVWLYSGDVDRLSPTAVERIESDDLFVSPMVELELTYLHEIERLTVGGPDIIADLTERIGVGVSTVSLPAAVAQAHDLSWTRDPFDRLIVADALAAGDELLSADQRIREHAPVATW